MKRPLSDQNEALRDDFAGKAMQTLLETWPDKVNAGYVAQYDYPEVARQAYQIANAMMEEKFKQPTEVECPR